jgi:hypothetical protein
MLTGLAKGEVTATPQAEVATNKKPLDLSPIALAQALTK